MVSFTAVSLLVALFIILVVGSLVAIVVWFPMLAFQRVKNKFEQDMTREPTDRDREILAYMKSSRIETIELMYAACDRIEGINVEEPLHDSYLDKFDASKAKRKQSPASQATPVVKSKRGRK